MESTDTETGRPLPLYTVKYTEKNKLTDEEVWLRAYCASISNSKIETPDYWRDDAARCLDDFKEKFRQEE